MYDNQVWEHRGVCGSVSWQLINQNGKPYLGSDNLGRRIVVTYYVSYRYFTK